MLFIVLFIWGEVESGEFFKIIIDILEIHQLPLNYD